MSKLEVGTRVAISNKRGTVKFCGHLNEVDGGKDLWFGIDWDHAGEGKHDGSLKGVQHFKARYPTSGSFVKATQVQTGQKFMETLKNHYFELYNNVDNENGIQFVLKESAVSFENAFNMTAINLPTKLISCLEPDADQTFEKCTLLDLSCNLLQEWTEVFATLKLFPALDSLNISLNVMQPIKSDMPMFQCQIKELILNDCHLDLETLASLADYFPALETLRIMKNELDTLPSLNKFTKLKNLHAGNNPFNDFTKLYQLSSHPTLETLSLPNCGFKAIKIPEQPGFNSLQTLNLNENPLNDWESINELGRLPCLTNFRSSGLYAGERGCQSYEILIAKLPHLNVLDSCTITSSDRKECESFFVRHFSKDPLLNVHQADLDRLSILYPEQLQPIPTRQIDSNSCTFTLKYNEQSIERTLLLNLSVRKLVTLASRIFSFEPSSVRVLVQIFDDSYEILKWDSSTVLRAFEPQQGCIIKFAKSMSNCY
ncbi:Tubulin-specific chaperone E [Aphelenchoides bicaudatus]|nr:Tubulin-specific chaperone E [Aphelenchoides bicaudatus]